MTRYYTHCTFPLHFLSITSNDSRVSILSRNATKQIPKSAIVKLKSDSRQIISKPHATLVPPGFLQSSWNNYVFNWFDISNSKALKLPLFQLVFYLFLNISEQEIGNGVTIQLVGDALCITGPLWGESRRATIRYVSRYVVRDTINDAISDDTPTNLESQTHTSVNNAHWLPQCQWNIQGKDMITSMV